MATALSIYSYCMYQHVGQRDTDRRVSDKGDIPANASSVRCLMLLFDRSSMLMVPPLKVLRSIALIPQFERFLQYSSSHMDISKNQADCMATSSSSYMTDRSLSLATLATAMGTALSPLFPER